MLDQAARERASPTARALTSPSKGENGALEATPSNEPVIPHSARPAGADPNPSDSTRSRPRALIVIDNCSDPATAKRSGPVYPRDLEALTLHPLIGIL
jgi:hypothetical protein